MTSLINSILGRRNPGDTTVVVTGATGYVAAFVVQQLLDKGYKVRGTSRSVDKEGKIAHLRALNGADERLEIVAADAGAPETLPAALNGAHVLLHMATPIDIPMTDEAMFKTEEEAYERQINPAVEGTRAILHAAADAGVEKVVLTSSTAAMMAQNPPASHLDADTWSDKEMMRANLLNMPHMAYFYAKTEQEQVAREVAEQLGLKLAAICPNLIIGPRLTPSIGDSLLMLHAMCEGKGILFTPSPPNTIPDGYLGIVDVREVAEAHVLAMENADATGRYLLHSHNVHYQDVVRVMRESHEAFAKLPEVPLDSEDGERHGEGMSFDNSPTRALGVSEIPWEDTIREVAHTIAETL